MTNQLIGAGMLIITLGGFAIENINTKQPLNIPNTEATTEAQETPNISNYNTHISEANASIAEAIQSYELPEVAPVEKQETTPPVEAKAKGGETLSSIESRSFRLNNGKYKTGKELLDYIKSDGNAKKLWQAFFDKYGKDIADTAGITLFYENGTFKPDTVGVCSSKYQINGDYRNCNYADKNSAGMDAGLKQINTFYQAKRITKLGGPSCTFGNSRDRTDPCNQKKIEWLTNVDNNIKIALDLYEEQGFTPWYGYKKAFKK